MPKITAQDLHIQRGDDSTVTFVHSDDNGPIDLTGHTIVFESSSAVLTQNALITDAQAGTYTLSFPRGHTAQLPRRSESYRVYYYPSGLTGTRETKFHGYLIIGSD